MAKVSKPTKAPKSAKKSRLSEAIAAPKSVKLSRKQLKDDIKMKIAANKILTKTISDLRAKNLEYAMKIFAMGAIVPTGIPNGKGNDKNIYKNEIDKVSIYDLLTKEPYKDVSNIYRNKQI